MKIRKFSEIQDDVYIVTLQTEDWSQADMLAIAQYGAPEIDVGGTFDDADETSFTLPSVLKHVSEPVFCQRFDLRDYADAQARADLWKTTMCQRIVDAVTALREQAVTQWSKEEVQNV